MHFMRTVREFYEKCEEIWENFQYYNFFFNFVETSRKF